MSGGLALEIIDFGDFFRPKPMSRDNLIQGYVSIILADGFIERNRASVAGGPAIE